jgi:hypothetical protein
MVQVASLSEQKTQIADQFLLKRIEILESSIKELRAYNWMPSVDSFIKESEDFLRRNEVYILVERIIFDLEMDKNRNYFSKALEKLREVSESENPVLTIVETMESERWIPLVKKLYEYANRLKGSVNGENPNFKVSHIYSPVVAIDNEQYQAQLVEQKVYDSMETSIGGRGIRTIKKVLYPSSIVDYRRMSVFDVENLSLAVDLVSNKVQSLSSNESLSLLL